MISLPVLKYIKIDLNIPHITIIINRPEKRNALNDTLVSELKEIFAWVKNNNSLKVITLKGEGEVFCSGADLKYLKKLKNYSHKENLKDSISLSKLFLEIYAFPKPVIAIVKGAALAGGCGLASVCDFIISDIDAVFGYPEVRIGFVAALVSTFLIRQIGERKARELLLTGNIISANKAKDIGLISEVTNSDKIEDIHEELLNNLIHNSSQAMKITKEIISSSVFKDIEKELKFLSKINASFRETDDFLEGISAFLEKRSPVWKI